ncbi:MAG: hypothetical protein PVI43_05870 [Candidatus Bathyarchaeota archaeon]
MKIQNRLLFAISIISIIIVVFQLWSTIPNIGEYASDAHLFDSLEEGNVWADWVLEARENLVEVPIALILNVCFFSLVAFWSFSGALEKENQTSAKPEATN